MNTLELPGLLEQQIVNGIMRGYKEYLEIRKSANEKLAVSGAYAWVKGNHIDSSVKVSVSSLENISVQSAKAGFAWEYLQFITKSEDAVSKSLIFVKSSRSMMKKFDGETATINTDNYLYGYSEINNRLIATGKLKGQQSKKKVQLELVLPGEPWMKPDSVPLLAEFSRFYIVTYEIDNESKQVSQIKLTMPSQLEMSLIEITDLTPLIENSKVTFTEDDFDVIRKDRIPDAVYNDESFGYEVSPETKGNRMSKE